MKKLREYIFYRVYERTLKNTHNMDEAVNNATYDSVYRKKGKEVRSVSISPEDKSVTTSEYDEKGNIIMEIRKSKTNITISEEEFKGMIQRYKESKKQEN